MIATEQVLGETPLVVRRRGKWGECDPAGVASTVSFSQYVVSAAELFYGALFQTTPQRGKAAQGFGTPIRALAFDFQRSLWPDEVFDMNVTVAALHQRSYVLNVTSRTPDGAVVFAATLTPVCVARDERRSTDIPTAFRAALARYRNACTAAPTSSATSATVSA